MSSITGDAIARVIFTIIIVALIIAAFTYILHDNPLIPLIEQLKSINESIRR